MPFETTPIPGILLFAPVVFEDSRGYFFEAYNEETFHQAGVRNPFIQDNQSRSKYGVIRGLHYQLNPFAQAKLVRVLEGTILDVVVDIRKGSPTYGESYSVELSADNKKQIFIPAGFAHGFSVLSETASVLYKCDHLYRRESERGILWNDPQLQIDWKVPAEAAVISAKDEQLPLFSACDTNFVFES